MSNDREHPQNPEVEFTIERIARENAIHERYGRRPNLRELYERGEIDQEAYEKASRFQDEGPFDPPYRELITALRAERERQGLSLSDVAKRTGMDRAAIHKLEIGLNNNPTLTTLARYAEALGQRIGWTLKNKVEGEPVTGR
jgi:DNA-binding phage protein